MSTTIEWTEETWNPVVGCTKTSPGCDNCYAIGVAHRALQPAHAGLTVRVDGERADWTGELRCLPERLEAPLRWRRPRRVFVNSMSDLFHPGVPRDFIVETFAVMAAAAQHTFQVLTKRPHRMAQLLADPAFWVDVERAAGAHTHAYDDDQGPPPNVWLGTSIETDRYGFRAAQLLRTPAAVRFLSIEPLLGPINLSPYLWAVEETAAGTRIRRRSGIDWVIVGGESGPGARPMHPDWARMVRDQCADADVPFFFKQWGGRTPKAGGRELDGRTWDEMPAATR